jgi:short-subunit dehydrogenase
MKDKGVNVTVLMPGPTDTELFERAEMTDTVVGRGSKQDPVKSRKRLWTHSNTARAMSSQARRTSCRSASPGR